MQVGHVLVEAVDILARESAVLTYVQLASSLLVAEDQLNSVQFALVRLERTALSKRLVTAAAPVRTNAWKYTPTDRNDHKKPTYR